MAAGLPHGYSFICLILFAPLHNLYWSLRYYRFPAARRRYYRLISAEKKRLIALGVDMEEVRLLCRSLSNPRNERAEQRLEFYRRQLKSYLPMS